MIDWTRKTRTSSSEDIAETDNLSNTTTESRAIHEIAQATAAEVQSGSSHTTTKGNSSEGGYAGGGLEMEDDVGKVIKNLLLPGGILRGTKLVGRSGGSSNNYAHSDSYSVSNGTREVHSEMMQNINASTYQNAFSARNRRATMITETSESESETIRTRTVTNYNHMHAMTVQYYEVIQNYRAVIGVEKVKPVIYLPFEPITFDDNIIAEFRPVLLNFAKTAALRYALVNENFGVDARIMTDLFWETGEYSAIPDGPAISPQERERAKRAAIDIAKKNAIEKARLKVQFATLRTTSKILSKTDQGSFDFSLEKGVKLINVSWVENNITGLLVNEISINKKEVDFDSEVVHPDISKGAAEGIDVKDLTTITLQHKGKPEKTSETIKLKFLDTDGRTGVIKFRLCLKKDEDKTIFLEFSGPDIKEDLHAALNADRLYYTQKIWRYASPSWLMLQLGRYSIDGRSVLDFIDPAPVSVVGNTVVFYWNAEDYPDHLSGWLDNNKAYNKTSEQIIAIPTSGVFAEAVLGRFNCAEKLDMTRFWNWQDSPIPVNAPDIAAIQAGNHTTTAATTAGTLSQPIINMSTPQAMPDPTGMQGILQVIASNNMFRDMSGLVQTSQLAQAALNAAAQGASHASTQSGSNMATVGQFSIEMAKVGLEAAKLAASMAPMLAGMPPIPVMGGNSTGTSNISNAGAAVNHGAKMDARNNEQAANPNPLVFDGQAANSNGNGAIQQKRAKGNTGSNEKKAFDNTVNRTLEFPVPESKAARGGFRNFSIRLVFKDERNIPFYGTFSIDIQHPFNPELIEKVENQNPRMGGVIQLYNIKLEDTELSYILVVSGYIEADGTSMAELYEGQVNLTLPIDRDLIDVTVGLYYAETEVKAESTIGAIDKFTAEVGLDAAFKFLMSAEVESVSTGSENSVGGNIGGSVSGENNSSTTTSTTYIVRYPSPGLNIKQIN